MKAVLFGLIVVVVVSITGYLIWSTVSKNIKSVTGGPVHYHADFEIWKCGQKLDLIDPHGLENKIGTSLFHEHNDNRIHVEGPISDYEDVSLGEFFKVIGGSMSSNLLVVPTNEGMVSMENGMICNGVASDLQVFVYRSEGNTFYQEKLKEPSRYVLSPYSTIPPGDCIIIEFGKIKERTDKLCNFYEVAIKKEELRIKNEGSLRE